MFFILMIPFDFDVGLTVSRMLKAESKFSGIPVGGQIPIIPFRLFRCFATIIEPNITFYFSVNQEIGVGYTSVVLKNGFQLTKAI